MTQRDRFAPDVGRYDQHMSESGRLISPPSFTAKRLIAVVRSPEADAPDIALWALYPTRRLLSARVSAFLDYLKAAFPTGAPEELAAFIAR